MREGEIAITLKCVLCGVSDTKIAYSRYEVLQYFQDRGWHHSQSGEFEDSCPTCLPD